jgi:hypothetical protein
MTITRRWRGDFDNTELNELHAEALETRVFEGAEWDWVSSVDACGFNPTNAGLIALQGGEREEP